MKTRFKPKFNIKKGDSVVVITGDDKDLKKPRKVLEVVTEKNRVLVEGVNIVTKHTKPSAQNTKGGILKKEAPIAISNVMMWDAKSSAPSKVKRTRENGKLVRIAKKSGEVIK
ncbi:MAG: 50S ribosomal protein L24 [Chitinophagaceae bacterium]|jgi:large subunit ribosomal protein L24|nr:50S ribosomal protein L24 [Chitinophagaceae bacterium]